MVLFFGWEEFCLCLGALEYRPHYWLGTIWMATPWPSSRSLKLRDEWPKKANSILYLVPIQMLFFFLSSPLARSKQSYQRGYRSLYTGCTSNTELEVAFAISSRGDTGGHEGILSQLHSGINMCNAVERSQEKMSALPVAGKSCSNRCWDQHACTFFVRQILELSCLLMVLLCEIVTSETVDKTGTGIVGHVIVVLFRRAVGDAVRILVYMYHTRLAYNWDQY